MKYLMESGPALKHAELPALEEYFGKKLPDDYAEFLAHCNGGVPDGDIKINVAGASSMPTDLQVFFGISRNVETSNLKWNIDGFRARFPGHDALPVACDSGGNLFLIRYELGKASGVEYVDEEGTFNKVAKSFSDFIRAIGE